MLDVIGHTFQCFTVPELLLCASDMAKTSAHIIIEWGSRDETTHRLKQSKIEEG